MANWSCPDRPDHLRTILGLRRKCFHFKITTEHPTPSSSENRPNTLVWFFYSAAYGLVLFSVNAVNCYCTPLTPLINNYAESRKQRVRAQGRLHGLVITMSFKISFDWDDSYLVLRAVRSKRTNLFPTMENCHSVSPFSESPWQWTSQSAPCCGNAATDWESVGASALIEEANR